MPPRKRKRPEPAPEPDRPAEDPASASDHEDDDHNNDGVDTRSDIEDDDESSHLNLRFYNTTFSTYRASPLYVNPNLDASKQHQKKQAPSSSSSSSSILFTPKALETLSKRLRDTLVGDVVRGVQVGLGGPEGDVAALGRTGALLRVEWRWRGVDSLLGYDGRRRAREGSEELGGVDNDDDDGDRKSVKNARALCLSLEYENATFGAFLLPDLGGSEEGDGDEEESKPSWTWQPPAADPDSGSHSSFIHLPLLLLRMPAALKSVLIDFLSITFDCRISPLHLGTRTLVRSWETWLASTSGTPVKDAALTLGFHVPGEPPPADGDEEDGKTAGQELRLGLKSIDIIVPAGQVQRFVRAGRGIISSNHPSKKKRGLAPDDRNEDDKKRQRRRMLAGGRDEEGWGWRREDPITTTDDDLKKKNSKGKGKAGGEREEKEGGDDDNTFFDQPFAEALAAYLDAHLALDLFHPGVRVLRVACDGFALSSGGRVKVFASGAVSWTFMRDLVGCAKGGRRRGRRIIKGEGDWGGAAGAG
ncbi:kinetochore complex Sim4 subunit Fta1-domain-containing protein [Biscogniauxia mediterranea]|nr:kinetochore complex Sim4 subunit Fta1-domain-containing protein [Biscogniauxia mediterranea]